MVKDALFLEILVKHVLTMSIHCTIIELHEGGVTMSTTTTLNVRVEEELKKQADALFAELGLNMSSALNVFLHEAVRYGGIPFVIRIEKPNASTHSAINDVNKKRNLSDSFSDVNALMDELNA